MDPRVLGGPHQRLRFPRPRGDGPLHAAPAGVDHRVSPPTRGWTLHLLIRRSRPAGFPAHAGMDPPAGTSAGNSTGFPRPRGDGPVVTFTYDDAMRVSPPTRGWTTMLNPISQLLQGFPAHAGMDPLQHDPQVRMDGFPRPRGDGPCAASDPCENSRVSPPTRGWTVVVHVVSDSLGGFPAHAGMDPRCGRLQVLTRWFPRPRGDGPRARRSCPATG